jgi:hypothetical protein
MSKISNTTSYPTKENPLGTDYVIGTDDSSKETKTFTLQSIANLYSGSGAGTVTSVGFSLNGLAGLTLTGDNPITGAGTITLGINGSPSSGQYLDYQGNWTTPTNTTYDVMGSGNSYLAGLVLAGDGTHNNNFLRKDGTWATPSGAGTVTGTGTANTLSKWSTGGTGIENSTITDTGSIVSIGNPTVLKGDGSTNASNLKLNCSNNNHWVEFIGPNHIGSPASYSITLPNKIATQSAVSGGRVLEVNASGVGNWITTPAGSSGVASVTTTDGTFIDLTPNSATTGAVTVTADLSASGTASATKFLRGDNSWAVPGSAGHTIIDMADADTVTSAGGVNATYLMTTTVDSDFTASSIKLQFEIVPTTTTIEVGIYTYVEQGINSTTSNVRLGHGSSSGSTTKRKVISLTADDGPGLALTAGTNYVVALRCVGGNTGSGVFAASGKLSSVDYAATIDGNPALPTELKSGAEGNYFTATAIRPALTIY